MASPAVDNDSVSTLFTLDSPSKAGQAEAGVVAGLYFLAWLSLTAQIPACKGKYYAVVVTSLFAAGQQSIWWSACVADIAVPQLNTSVCSLYAMCVNRTGVLQPVVLGISSGH